MIIDHKTYKNVTKKISKKSPAYPQQTSEKNMILIFNHREILTTHPYCTHIKSHKIWGSYVKKLGKYHQKTSWGVKVPRVE